MGVLTQSTPPDTSFLLLSTLPWARAKAVRRASRKTKELSVLLTGGGWELSNGLCWNGGERKLDWISFLMGHKSTILMEDPLDSGVWREPETVWTDICLPVAATAVSDAIGSIAFPHFQLLLCSGEKARADEWRRKRMNERESLCVTGYDLFL